MPLVVDAERLAEGHRDEARDGSLHTRTLIHA